MMKTNCLCIETQEFEKLSEEQQESEREFIVRQSYFVHSRSGENVYSRERERENLVL